MTPSTLRTVAAATASGVVLGAAFPPVGLTGCVWFGLAPLLLAIRRAHSVREAATAGWVTGTVFALLTLYPLVSASAWTGWSAQTSAQAQTALTVQRVFLLGVWAVFAASSALLWAAWAGALRWMTGGRFGAWWLVLATALWVLLVEAARAAVFFGFNWAFLGNAAADWARLRAWVSVGGVLLISALIVLANAGLAACVAAPRAHWRQAAAAAVVVLLAWAAGPWIGRVPSEAAAPALLAAAVQHHRAQYTPADFTEFGLDRSYVAMLEEALKRSAQLIVLPESIALGTVSLDGTASRTKPAHRQISKQAWDAALAASLRGRDALVIVGLDTVERGQDHNTLLLGTAAGVQGWYHKQRLVPFSEHRPAGWPGWAWRGTSAFTAGVGSQLLRTNGLTIGAFICQEVLVPSVTRRSVRDGATLLVSGGNDGVFSDPSVARIHADAAQLRAAETGRHIIRAMKTGVSAILRPDGEEQTRSVSDEPTVLLSRVRPLTHRTPYVRFGDWVLWPAGLAVAIALLRRPGAAR